MWDGVERRQHPRFKVNWNGTLHCILPDSRRIIQVSLLDISESGCSIALEKQAEGTTYIADLCNEGSLSLALTLREGAPSFQVEIRWYLPASENLYNVGMEFVSMTARNREILLKAMQRLR